MLDAAALDALATGCKGSKDVGNGAGMLGISTRRKGAGFARWG